MAEISQEFLQHLGLSGYQQRTPKVAWQERLQRSMELIYDLPESLASLRTLFSVELQEIIWLQPIAPEAEAFASAAYPEVPGKVFLTSGVFAYIPPAQSPGKISLYCAFENMVHECLHHRGEKIFRSHNKLSQCMSSYCKVTVSWRQTSWSFSHAIQAYYVYLWIRRLRRWRSQCTQETSAMKEMLKQSLTEVENIIDELENQLSSLAGISQQELRSLCI